MFSYVEETEEGTVLYPKNKENLTRSVKQSSKC